MGKFQWVSYRNLASPQFSVKEKNHKPFRLLIYLKLFCSNTTFSELFFLILDTYLSCILVLSSSVVT